MKSSFRLLIALCPLLVCSSAFASMTNPMFTLTHAAVASGGGMGASASASSQFVLKSSRIGETASSESANPMFILRGGLVTPFDITDGLMRIHVKGTTDDPNAILYVNEVCAINQGTSWTAPFVTVREGANVLHVHSYDSVGNERAMTVNITVDTKPPAMPTAVYESPTANPNYTITGTKPASADLWLRQNGVESRIDGFFESASWSYVLSLEEGMNHIQFFLIDPAGNKGSAYLVDIVLDTDTTMFEVVSPRNGSVTSSATIDVIGRVLDDTAEIQVGGQVAAFLENGSYFRRENVILPLLGANDIPVHAESITGFVQDQTLSVIRDDNALLPPSLNSIPPYLGTTSLELSGSCDVDGGVAVCLNSECTGGLLPRPYVDCASGAWNLPIELAVGENVILAEGVDSLDRRIVGPAASVFVDVTAPTIPVVSDGGGVQSSTIEITVSLFSYDNETTVTEFEYAVGTSPLPPEGIGFIAAASSPNQPFTITGNLELDQTYYIYVRTKNTAGLWSPVGVSDGIRISDNQIPSILMLLPEKGEFRYPGDSIAWRLIVHDPDEDVLEFKYALNGLTFFTFSEEPERIFTVPTGMFGKQIIRGQVRDDPENVFVEWPSAETSFFVVKRPVEP